MFLLIVKALVLELIGYCKYRNAKKGVKPSQQAAKEKQDPFWEGWDTPHDQEGPKKRENAKKHKKNQGVGLRNKFRLKEKNGFVKKKKVEETWELEDSFGFGKDSEKFIDPKNRGVSPRMKGRQKFGKKKTGSRLTFSSRRLKKLDLRAFLD